MDWRWWHRARDKGVLCAINPDAHSPMRLPALAFGIRPARKGWLRKEDVLNTRQPPWPSSNGCTPRKPNASEARTTYRNGLTTRTPP